ncbi:MAG: VCBS repeat-containing protein [candidate division Zixibacteria bacterium]|nr:VCBS repeat-containing protein [candidate division Zixibacteria bacterium]
MIRTGLLPVAVAGVLLVIAAGADAQIKMSGTAIWNAGNGLVPTGIGWTDLDGDGWRDLVVACGLDQTNAPLVAYRNNGGHLETSAMYTSDYRNTHCNLYLGDLDSDGDDDVVVASLGRTAASFPLQPQMVYYNDGGFSANPDWLSPRPTRSPAQPVIRTATVIWISYSPRAMRPAAVCKK